MTGARTQLIQWNHSHSLGTTRNERHTSALTALIYGNDIPSRRRATINSLVDHRLGNPAVLVTLLVVSTSLSLEITLSSNPGRQFFFFFLRNVISYLIFSFIQVLPYFKKSMDQRNPYLAKIDRYHATGGYLTVQDSPWNTPLGKMYDRFNRLYVGSCSSDRYVRQVILSLIRKLIIHIILSNLFF